MVVLGETDRKKSCDAKSENSQIHERFDFI
jgi:hypothetical protein